MKNLASAVVVPLVLLLCFWLIEIAEVVYGFNLHALGVYPREVRGLVGIVTSPFIHGDFEHLMANSIPFLVMGAALFYFYKDISLRVFVFIWLFSGLFVWLTGRPAWHIGASGVVHGLFAFLFVSGLVRRSKELIAISLLSVFLYGSMVWGFLPGIFPERNISYEAHGGGLLVGVLLSVIYRKKGPQRKVYHWDDDDTDEMFYKPGLKIVVDEAIPFIKGVFEPYAYVQYLKGDRIAPSDVYDADALIVRTRTKCNRKLLEGSKVKFIATATIGYDHIDTDYCRRNGIRWVNAPGCNSGSVAQYVASTLAMLAVNEGMDLSSKTIGIIGVGHVGKKIACLAEVLGMNVLLYDPPRALKEGAKLFTNLETIQEEADIITFHVPLKYTSQDATYHLADDFFFRQLKRKPYIINTSRGEVVETAALEKALHQKMIAGCILDVFENEPEIERKLIDQCLLATPHIAGYSADGKANGTVMTVRSVADFFQLPMGHWEVPALPAPETPPIIYSEKYDGFWLLAHAMLSSYPIALDDARLRSEPAAFERLRSNYPIRREYPAHTVVCSRLVADATKGKLAKLGFKVQTEAPPTEEA